MLIRQDLSIARTCSELKLKQHLSVVMEGYFMKKLYLTLIVLILLSMALVLLLGTRGRGVNHQIYNTWKKMSKNNCCNEAAANRLEVLCLKEPYYYHDCSCTEYMMCKLVMVTGISSKKAKHFSGQSTSTCQTQRS